VLSALLYHLPLFSFAAGTLDLSSLTGDLTLTTLLLVLLFPTNDERRLRCENVERNAH
jgi:hypothetical protein